MSFVSNQYIQLYQKYVKNFHYIVYKIRSFAKKKKRKEKNRFVPSVESAVQLETRGNLDRRVADTDLVGVMGNCYSNTLEI